MGKNQKIKNRLQEFEETYVLKLCANFWGILSIFELKSSKKLQFFSLIFPLIFPLGNNKGFGLHEKVGIMLLVITFEPFIFRSWLTTHFEEER